MFYYVISIKTGREERYIKIANRLIPDTEGRLIWPRRSLIIRKRGRKIESLSSLYPGYLFWETQEFSYAAKMILMNIPGFIKFLKNNITIMPLRDTERDMLLEIISHGEIIKRSIVDFDKNKRIRVIDGPLKCLEGSIIKVDRRKNRAKVQLSLHGNSIFVDIGFDVIGAV